MSQQYIQTLMLVGTFKNAVEAKIQSDPALLQKAQTAIKPEEMENMMEQMFDTAGAIMGLAFGEVSEEDVAAITKFQNTFTGVARCIFSDEELIALMPEELKTPQAAALLEANNAPDIARLCKPVLT